MIAHEDIMTIVRYGIAGGINTAASVIAYAVLIYGFSAPFWLANFFAMLAGISCGFCLARIYVFPKTTSSAASSSWRYILTILAQFALSTSLIAWLLTFGFSEMYAFLLVLPIVIIFSYLLQRNWVFLRTSSNEVN